MLISGFHGRNTDHQRQRWAKWRLSTFDLYPGGEGHGMQGQICDILTPASYESLPAPSGHTDSHILDTYIWGGGGLLSEIVDRCRAFDLFASVDAHLWIQRSALQATQDVCSCSPWCEFCFLLYTLLFCFLRVCVMRSIFLFEAH